jgi:hypothetical protein
VLLNLVGIVGREQGKVCVVVPKKPSQLANPTLI